MRSRADSAHLPRAEVDPSSISHGGSPPACSRLASLRTGSENPGYTPNSVTSPGRVWLAAACPIVATTASSQDARARTKRRRAAASPSTTCSITQPERRQLQDVVTCIREHVTLDAAGKLLEANAERHLKPAEEMARLFRDAPEAIAETLRFAERITFTLDQLKYNYPDEPVPQGKTPQEHLDDLTWEGAAKRYPDGIPDKVRATLEKELALIAELESRLISSPCTTSSRFARREENSLPGPRLGRQFRRLLRARHHRASIPLKIDLLFERFISRGAQGAAGHRRRFRA